VWSLRNRTGFAAERNWTRDRDGVQRASAEQADYLDKTEIVEVRSAA
jgi:hypothetical protein